MAEYNVVIIKSAAKELAKLPLNAIERIRQAVNGLVTDPCSVECRRLKGFKDLFRIRSGDYRIIYRVEDKLLIVEVVRIGDHEDIYS